jgi:hypothetical protein
MSVINWLLRKIDFTMMWVSTNYYAIDFFVWRFAFHVGVRTSFCGRLGRNSQIEEFCVQKV